MLPGKTRDMILPDKPWSVAGLAMISLRDGGAVTRSRRVDAGDLGSRPLREKISAEILHVTIAEASCLRRHEWVDSALLAKLQQLIINIQWRLGGKRGHSRLRRVAGRTMAGNAGRRFGFTCRRIAGRVSDARKPEQD